MAEKISWKSWLILLTLSLVWGSSFILIKKGLAVYSPVQVAYMRLSFSALAFFPIFLIRFKKIDWKQWKYLLIVGLAGSAIPAFLFSTAQTQINSSVAGLLNSLTPLFTLVLGMLLFGVSAGWYKIGGVLVGLLGAASLIFFQSSNDLGGNNLFGLLIVAGTVCYGTSANTVGAFLKNMKSLDISAASFFLVGWWMPFALLLGTDFTTKLAEVEGAVLAMSYILILALFGTVLASLIFFYLIQQTSAIFASMITYLMPVVALIWGVLDGEGIAWVHFFGMGLILFGVYLVRRN
ncbi:MAG TPA: EamA family transporter [Saprospiraceae bacterium]|nr:EamA family transporter [Saprospiraceae bacterium]HMQ83299.1 EamA family transporter [Saprospiraceae bacterium]